MNASILIVTLGFPGSGKTYFSEKLAKDKKYFYINSDKIRYEMFGSPKFTNEEHRKLFNLIEWLTEALLKMNISVIVDAPPQWFVSHEPFYYI